VRVLALFVAAGAAAYARRDIGWSAPSCLSHRVVLMASASGGSDANVQVRRSARITSPSYKPRTTWALPRIVSVECAGVCVY
jgi:hypothetical protein